MSDDKSTPDSEQEKTPAAEPEKVESTEATAKTETSEAAQTSAVKEATETAASQEAEKTGPFAWFGKMARWQQAALVSVVAFILLGGIAYGVPTTRYQILNVFSSVSLTVTVYDSDTETALPNASVTIGETTLMTNDDGQVMFEDLSRGATTITAMRTAYAEASQEFTISKDGLETTLQLAPTGNPLEVTVSSITTGDPILDFTVTIADSDISATSNENGLAVLNVPNAVSAGEVLVTAAGFNDASMSFEDPQNFPTVSVSMLLNGRHVFLSNRSGTIDVVSANFDGSDRQIIAEGTGKEEGSASLHVTPNGEKAVLIAARKGIRDDDNVLTREVYVIDIPDGTITLVDEGAQSFNFAGITNEYGFYATNQGQEYGDVADRRADNSKLKTVRFSDNDLETIAQTYGSVTDQLFVDGRLFYQESAIASIESQFTERDRDLKMFTPGSEPVTVFKPDYDGVLIQISDTEVYFTSNYNDDNVYSFDNPRYLTYDFVAKELTESDQSNNSPRRNFDPSPDGENIAWVERRDSRNVLVVGDRIGSTGDTVFQAENVGYIIRWVDNDHILVNGDGPDRNVDFLVNINTGASIEVSSIFDYDTSYYRYRGYY